MKRQLKISHRITNRTMPIDKLFNEIRKYRVLSHEEETELFYKYREKGDLKAREMLYLHNLKFVVSVAKQYVATDEGGLADFFSEGSIGLNTAIDKFDTTRGFKFITYAVWWIRQAITGYISESGRIVRLPLNKIGKLSEYSKLASVFEQKHERLPTKEEMCDLMPDKEFHKMGDLISASHRSISLDAPMLYTDESSNITMLDTLEADNKEPYLEADLKLEIDKALSLLKPMEKEVICMIYGIGHKHCYTYEDIAKRYDYHKQNIVNIKRKALAKIQKNPTMIKALREYLS